MSFTIKICLCDKQMVTRRDNCFIVLKYLQYYSIALFETIVQEIKICLEYYYNVKRFLTWRNINFIYAVWLQFLRSPNFSSADTENAEHLKSSYNLHVNNNNNQFVATTQCLFALFYQNISLILQRPL